MQKYLFRIAAFALTFVFALGLFWFSGLFDFSADWHESALTKNLSDEISVTEDENFVQTSANGEIEVHFKKFVTTAHGTAVEMEIVNKSTKSAFYSAYNHIAGEQTGYLYPFSKIDGKEQQEFICGTGYEMFELKSGQTIMQTSNLSYDFLEKGEHLQLGYSFGFDRKEEFQKRWSEVLPISEQLKQRIKANQ